MMDCKKFFGDAYYEYSICLEPAGIHGDSSLFGISEYLGTLALLLVIYNISDDRYKFRLSLQILPIYTLAFWFFVFVGFLKFFIELWFYFSWPIFRSLNNKGIFDIFLIGLCVLAVFFWIYVAFIKPPTFSYWNCEKFFHVYRKVTYNGTKDELRIALSELSRSAAGIVELAARPPGRNSASWKPSKLTGAAHDMILLLGNQRICKEMVESCPDTAAIFFEEVAKQGRIDIPFGVFAKNVSKELLTNKSSPIFQEESGWDSGWFGYAQIYSTTVFTNPDIITALARQHLSPLDVSLSQNLRWDGDNWAAYCRVSLLYISRIIEDELHLLDDFSVNQIFASCEWMIADTYKIDGVDNAYFMMDEYKRLQTAVGFAHDIIDLLHKKNVPIRSRQKPADEFHNGIHERVSQLIFKIIFAASKVHHPYWTSFAVQQSTVWSRLFGYVDSNTSLWVYRRVSRLIYDEIAEMDRWFNFKGASYLGFCLNVLSLSQDRGGQFRSHETPLRLAALSWVRRSYSRMCVDSPKVAMHCLQGRITFDDRSKELICTYSNETGKGADETRFKVD